MKILVHFASLVMTDERQVINYVLVIAKEVKQTSILVHVATLVMTDKRHVIANEVNPRCGFISLSS